MTDLLTQTVRRWSLPMSFPWYINFAFHKKNRGKFCVSKNNLARSLFVSRAKGLKIVGTVRRTVNRNVRDRILPRFRPAFFFPSSAHFAAKPSLEMHRPRGLDLQEFVLHRDRKNSFLPVHSLSSGSRRILLLEKTVMLQFPSLPNGIVKDCRYSGKLAKESDGLLLYGAHYPEEVPKSKKSGSLLRGELKLGLQRGKHQRDCTFA